ncbi:hypothetical protein [Paraburkholderia sp. 32]|uniref:hypothetical protein n=1 Tax=Paraburkholderia sp. 32 TaxID=2991057 RepID=UPI003D22530A
MIHYHGLPITPNTAALRAVGSGHAFVSFEYPEQLGLVLDVAQSFAVDNGAFSAWCAGRPVRDWSRYYAWVAELHRYPPFDFAVIPDVIDGDEAANDALIAEWPWRFRAPWTGAPVWHLHESLERLERLERLALAWPRVCLGSSGQYATIGTDAWWTRMAEAMDVVCDRDGRPVCKLHGLRMLDVDVFTRFPFASADSTNIGRNVGIDSRWRGSYTPASKEARAQVMRERIEAHPSLICWQREHAPIQTALSLEAL